MVERGGTSGEGEKRVATRTTYLELNLRRIVVGSLDVAFGRALMDLLGSH